MRRLRFVGKLLKHSYKYMYCDSLRYSLPLCNLQVCLWSVLIEVLECRG